MLGTSHTIQVKSRAALSRRKSHFEFKISFQNPKSHLEFKIPFHIPVYLCITATSYRGLQFCLTKAYIDKSTGRTSAPSTENTAMNLKYDFRQLNTTQLQFVALASALLSQTYVHTCQTAVTDNIANPESNFMYKQLKWIYHRYNYKQSFLLLHCSYLESWSKTEQTQLELHRCKHQFCTRSSPWYIEPLIFINKRKLQPV